MSYQLFSQLNPNLEYRWLICNNAPNYIDFPIHDEYIMFERRGEMNGSVAHSRSLNFLFSERKRLGLEADYHFTLDPDFYIFHPVSYILDRMESLGVATFGAPYGVSRFPVIRNQPTAYCQVWNDKMVDINTFDFTCYVTKDTEQKIKEIGYVRDVGHKLMIRLVEGEFSSYSLPYSGMVEEGFVDMFHDQGKLFALHTHTRRQQTKENAEMSNISLRQLERMYKKYKHKDMPDFDFSATKNVPMFISKKDMSPQMRLPVPRVII